MNRYTIIDYPFTFRMSCGIHNPIWTPPESSTSLIQPLLVDQCLISDLTSLGIRYRGGLFSFSYFMKTKKRSTDMLPMRLLELALNMNEISAGVVYLWPQTILVSIKNQWPVSLPFTVSIDVFYRVFLVYTWRHRSKNVKFLHNFRNVSSLWHPLTFELR